MSVIVGKADLARTSSFWPNLTRSRHQKCGRSSSATDLISLVELHCSTSSPPDWWNRVDQTVG